VYVFTVFIHERTMEAELITTIQMVSPASTLTPMVDRLVLSSDTFSSCSSFGAVQANSSTCFLRRPSIVRSVTASASGCAARRKKGAVGRRPRLQQQRPQRHQQHRLWVTERPHDYDCGCGCGCDRPRHCRTASK
jgi:hypothetical protein